jgi:hypothetical protein
MLTGASPRVRICSSGSSTPGSTGPRPLFVRTNRRGSLSLCSNRSGGGDPDRFPLPGGGVAVAAGCGPIVGARVLPAADCPTATRHCRLPMSDCVPAGDASPPLRAAGADSGWSDVACAITQVRAACPPGRLLAATRDGSGRRHTGHSSRHVSLGAQPPADHPAGCHRPGACPVRGSPCIRALANGPFSRHSCGFAPRCVALPAVNVPAS